MNVRRRVAATIVVGVLSVACAGSREQRAPAAICKGMGCGTEGWAALRAGDDRSAAARFMVGCETNDPPSCRDLAALYAAGRGVRQDEARACHLGLAEACRRAGLPEPAAPVSSTTPLPDPVDREEPRPTPVKLDDALDWGRYYVKDEWRAALGFTREALEAVPAAPLLDQELVRTVAGPRMRKLERCLPTLRGEKGPWPARGFAALMLDPDGRVRSPVVAVEDHPGRETSETCAREVVAAWEFPRPVVGGRIWLELEGRGPEVRLPEPPRPRPPAGSFTPPRLREPGCVGARLAVRPEKAGSLPPAVTVQFAVGRDGAISRFQMLTRDLPLDVIRAIERAVQSCPFEPGRVAGEPASIWVVMRVRFARPAVGWLEGFTMSGSAG